MTHVDADSFILGILAGGIVTLLAVLVFILQEVFRVDEE